MATALSILGLILSSGSSLWLMLYEISDRTKRAQRAQDLAWMKSRVQKFESLIKDTIKNVAEVNARLGHAAYDPDRETAKTRQHLEEAHQELEALEGPPGDVFLKEMVSGTHLGAFILLFIGFVLQLLAEIVKLLYPRA